VKCLFVKSRKSIVILTFILVAAISATSLGTVDACYFHYYFNRPDHDQYSSFTLIASGTAYDTSQHKSVQVGLTLSGTADGKLGSSIHLSVQSGVASVKGYQTFSISKGTGSLVQKGDKGHLELNLMSSPYCGKTAVWVLEEGRSSEKTVGNTIQMTFSGNNLKLPMDHSPELRNLVLNSTIKLK
jgi:hypothetical protein